MGTPNLRRSAIAAEVRAELARRQISVVRLSEATHITLPTLRNRLAGKSPFYHEELLRIADALGVGVSVFSDRADADL